MKKAELRKGGAGHKLTEIQSEFCEKVRERSLMEASRIAVEMGYTNFHRDKRTPGTALHKELIKIAKEEEKDISKSKAVNLNALEMIRDLALASGDMKDAIKAIEVINKMQGYDAPKKLEKKNTNIEVVVDLTKPPIEETEDVEYLDITPDED
jgi:hypothetical protein